MEPLSGSNPENFNKGMNASSEHLFERVNLWLNGQNGVNSRDAPVNLAYFPNLYEVCTLNLHLFFRLKLIYEDII